MNIKNIITKKTINGAADIGTFGLKQCCEYAYGKRIITNEQIKRTSIQEIFRALSGGIYFIGCRNAGILEVLQGEQDNFDGRQFLFRYGLSWTLYGLSYLKKKGDTDK